MMRELKFQQKFRPAMLTVFGKTLVCRDIDVASQYSKSANLDCVTMEGINNACIIVFIEIFYVNDDSQLYWIPLGSFC